jgi:hypothetical protein
MDEKPLLVQLNWHMDDREGRFLLRRIDDKTNVSMAATLLHIYLSLAGQVSSVAVFSVVMPRSLVGHYISIFIAEDLKIMLHNFTVAL